MKKNKLKHVKGYFAGVHKHRVHFEYWKYGQHTIHRDFAPARIFYYLDGEKKEEQWYTHGKLNNKHGPAIIEYDRAGNIKIEQYYLNGQKMTKEQHQIGVFAGLGDYK